MPEIKKILIANRGEIAVRIMRTCRELGIETVAIYSDADRTALHVRHADEAWYAGPAPAKDSYLQQDRILDIARKSGADAIHPGYGFLSENPVFAGKVADAGLIFIGPSAQAMRVMGDKTEARKTMQAAGVPIVPGTAQPLASTGEAVEVAAEVGYPVLLKAAAGGGGKGMRVVATEADMAASFTAASSEAQSAFGDGRVYIEKYIEEPRHIEIQIMADQHGNVIYLGERECSIQRRHQKVIEEAPSCIVSEEMRRKMGEAAVSAARACSYANAGTIEFLVDKNRNFYFLEMNTRLQVEHPVTEMVVGLDLVKMQIECAMGLPLALSQEEVRIAGHAIECRVYAEDPENNFLPSTGTITHLQKPDGPGIRDDSGVAEGDAISLYYDPMIAKLVAWEPTREQAIARMLRALHEYRITGVRTTIPFCAWVLEHERFRSGRFDTHFVNQEYFGREKEIFSATDELELHAAAIVAGYLFEQKTGSRSRPKTADASAGCQSPWKPRGWKQTHRTS